MKKFSIDAKSRRIKSEHAAKTGGAPVCSAMTSARRLLVHGLIPALIALITFVVFLPTLQNGFVNWDDDSHLLENPHYRGLGWEQLRWMFTTCFQWFLHALELGDLWLGLYSLGHEPERISFHQFACSCRQRCAFLFSEPAVAPPWSRKSDDLPELPIRLAAGFSALFFSLHPLQVEVVAWTIGREIAIAGFFFILTLLCYLRAAENESAGLLAAGWMVAAWIFYAMSLLGKEVALTLPFALLVLDVYPLRRLGGGPGRWFGPQVRRVWWEKIPFLLLALAAGVRATLEKQQAGSLYPMADYGFLPRFAQVLYSLAFYPWKTLIPTGLSPLYPVHPFTGLWNSSTLLSGAFVFSLTVGLFIARRRWPAGLAAWLFYGVLLMPVSGIVAFGPYRAADRFSYRAVPRLGDVGGGRFVLLLATLDVGGRLRRRTLVLAQSFAVLLLIALGTLTWGQTQIWRDSRDVVETCAGSRGKVEFCPQQFGPCSCRARRIGRGDEAFPQSRAV